MRFYLINIVAPYIHFILYTYTYSVNKYYVNSWFLLAIRLFMIIRRFNIFYKNNC